MDFFRQIEAVCERMIEKGEKVEPKVILAIISELKKQYSGGIPFAFKPDRIEVDNLEEAEYVLFDDGDICNNVCSFMTGVPYEIFESIEDENVLMVEDKNGIEKVVLSVVQEMQSVHPNVKVIFFKEKDAFQTVSDMFHATGGSFKTLDELLK